MSDVRVPWKACLKGSQTLAMRFQSLVKQSIWRCSECHKTNQYVKYALRVYGPTKCQHCDHAPCKHCEFDEKVLELVLQNTLYTRKDQRGCIIIRTCCACGQVQLPRVVETAEACADPAFEAHYVVCGECAVAACSHRSCGNCLTARLKNSDVENEQRWRASLRDSVSPDSSEWEDSPDHPAEGHDDSSLYGLDIGGKSADGLATEVPAASASNLARAGQGQTGTDEEDEEEQEDAEAMTMGRNSREFKEYVREFDKTDAVSTCSKPHPTSKQIPPPQRSSMKPMTNTSAGSGSSGLPPARPVPSQTPPPPEQTTSPTSTPPGHVSKKPKLTHAPAREPERPPPRTTTTTSRERGRGHGQLPLRPRPAAFAPHPRGEGDGATRAAAEPARVRRRRPDEAWEPREPAPSAWAALAGTGPRSPGAAQDEREEDPSRPAKAHCSGPDMSDGEAEDGLGVESYGTETLRQPADYPKLGDMGSVPMLYGSAPGSQASSWRDEPEGTPMGGCDDFGRGDGDDDEDEG
ncbi:hypothetical protein BDY21DRAFT_405189 [Lineolata rhizophorae]|uniref:Uncharacterized protein n=1 Tax=Lineolata rhizophorae TaxID=578093 RepID=A0A6A6NLK2_9PEZI|nr:hypothetical protein BDY21DRAFT_405189 [Lineolata rhizophorae]